MSKLKPVTIQPTLEALQISLDAFDALDVIGRWDWDATTDRTRLQGPVALLFAIDPMEAEAEAGVPADILRAAVHEYDRERVSALMARSAREGVPFITQYRVIAVDGRTHWLLARGHIMRDYAGRLLRGIGILVDVTDMRSREDPVVATERLPAEALLDLAADHAIAAQQAIVELQDPKLKILADALLMAVGRRLAQQEVQDRRQRMN